MTDQVSFIAPPGWPSVPAGRLPSAEWNPETSLPPAPSGWVFYRDANGVPVSPPPGSWTPPVTAPPVTQIPLVPTPPPVAPVPNAAPTHQGYSPESGPVASPGQFALGAPAAATTGAAIPAAGSGKSKVVPILIGAVALVLVVLLGVGGFTTYQAVFGPPQLSTTKFDRLDSVGSYGGQPVTFRQSIPVPWLWMGDEEGNLPACQTFADYDGEHVLAMYTAFTNPNGGMDGKVMFRLFGNNSEMSTYQQLWAQCEVAARAANLDTGKVGSTGGVTWQRFDESALFWYGNVQVMTTKSYDSDAQAEAEAIALKAVLDSLR